jgi:hypothetical protein
MPILSGLAQGNSGKFRLSDDGLTWETLADSDISDTVVFNSIALGENGSGSDLWIAVGTKANWRKL